jgi:hypothetical protein
LIPWGCRWTNKTPLLFDTMGLSLSKASLLLDTMGLSLNKQSAASTW